MASCLPIVGQKQWTTNFYCDGERIVRIPNINKGHFIEGSGDFILGQYLDESTRRFAAGQEFVGKITEVNFWDRSFESDVIETMSRDCRPEGSKLSGIHSEIVTMEMFNWLKTHRTAYCQVNVSFYPMNPFSWSPFGLLVCLCYYCFSVNRFSWNWRRFYLSQMRT